MAQETAKIDDNRRKALLGVSDDAAEETRNLLVDATTGRLKVSAVISASAITSINTDGTVAQTITVGTTGTDIAIVDDASGDHKINIPTASGTNRGALSSANWTTFNGKQATGAVLDDLNILGASTADNQVLISTGVGALAWESGATLRTSIGCDPIGTDNSTDVTIGTANGLSLVGQALSMTQADTDTTGALSDTDWDTFNNKVSNVTTNLSEGTSTETTVDVNSSDGTNATLVSASTTRAGLLTKAKWDEIVANSLKVTYPGDQTTIVGIAGTKAEFDTAVTDGNITYDGDAPTAHKDSHDPNNGSDKLDTAAAAEIASVQAAGTGTSHSFARADHAHQIQHSIANNHIVTIDHATPVDNDYAKFTASGLEGRSYAEVVNDIGANINAPAGFLLNGKIVPSVASNDLTVAIKGLDGNDPSATNPVYCRIGDTIRSITNALSVTKAAATNWCNAGRAEIATQDVDFFVYLGYNATDGVVIGFSRYPGALSYDEFSAVTTNDKYCGISTITNAAATDYYELIGRFAATLSAGAGYTWTVPAFTAKNLVQRPIYETRWLDFLPTYSAGGSMTFTSVTTDISRYKIKGSNCYIMMRAYGTTGGTTSKDIRSTIPITPAFNGWLVGVAVYDTETLSGTAEWDGIAFAMKWRNYAGNNWNLAASKYIIGNFFFEI